jgi:hypothetical protein
MKKKTTTIKQKGPVVAEVYETEIEYTCPVRGKVKQVVKVHRYASIEQTPPAPEILHGNSITDKLDVQYSGLMLEDDSLEESGGNGE